MIPPHAAAGLLASWAETGRVLRRAFSLQVWSGLVARRWLLVGLVFGVSAVLIESTLTARFGNAQLPRQVDAWDLFPGMCSQAYYVYVLFGFGFLLFVVDTSHRDREQGTAAQALARMPSRSLYWLGTMGAVGAMALGFVGLGAAAAFLVGLAIAPPSSAWPMLPRAGVDWMYPEAALPVPMYALLLIGYTAWALWVAGCAVVLLSHFTRRKVVVLGAVVLWAVLGLSATSLSSALGHARLLNLGYYISISKHHVEDPFPLGVFFAITGAALVLMAALGSWRICREEL